MDRTAWDCVIAFSAQELCQIRVRCASVCGQAKTGLFWNSLCQLQVLKSLLQRRRSALNLPYKSAHLVRSKNHSPCLGTFAKLRKATIIFVISVHLSIYPSVRMEKLRSHWTEFQVIWYMGNFQKSVAIIEVSLKSDKSKGQRT